MASGFLLPRIIERDEKYMMTAYILFGITAFLIGQYMGFHSALNGGQSIAKYTVAEMRLEMHEARNAVHDE